MPRRNTSRHIPERFLRQLWKHQYFSTNELSTSDGRIVTILSAGTLNNDGGPDFVNALIRIGSITYRGAVELHQNYDEWNEHCHDQDPKYNGVILHVVLYETPVHSSQSTKSKRAIPVLILEKYLNTSYRSLWEHMIFNERAERLSSIQCYEHNDSVDGVHIKQWLAKLAVQRIELKVRRFEERLKELIDTNRLSVQEPPSRYEEIPFGIHPEELPSPQPHYSKIDFSKLELWQQLLYEGIMEALGYSKNQQPFLKLAQNANLDFLKRRLSSISAEDSHLHTEAVLFGVAGLFPLTRVLTDNESKVRVRTLKKIWKQHRPFYSKEYLHEAEWQFFRLRPENFPTVRIAGASALIHKTLANDFLASVIGIIKRADEKKNVRLKELQKLFFVTADGFWSLHYRFGERSAHVIHALVGEQRCRDIIFNVVFPIGLLYARLFKDKELRAEILAMYEEPMTLNSNSAIRVIEQQLIKNKFKVNSVMLQQGAIQVYKFFCVEKHCSACAVGTSVFQE